MLLKALFVIVFLWLPFDGHAAEYVKTDRLIANSILSGRVDALPRDWSGSGGREPGPIQTRSAVVSALVALSASGVDASAASPDQMDVVASILKTLASAAKVEADQGDRNDLPAIVDAVWRTWVEPRMDRFQGQRSLSAEPGRLAGRWAEAGPVPVVSVFELLADPESRSLAWSNTDVGSRSPAAAAVVRAWMGSARPMAPVFVVFLDVSGIRGGARAATDPGSAVGVLVEDNAAAVEACVAAAAPPPSPPPSPQARGVGGSSLGLRGSEAPTPTPTPTPTPPAPSAETIRRTCVKSTPPLAGRPAVAVIVDRKRQAEVARIPLAGAADVSDAIALAAGLAEVWP